MVLWIIVTQFASLHALFELPALSLYLGLVIIVPFLTCNHSPILGAYLKLAIYLLHGFGIPLNVRNGSCIVSQCHLPALLAIQVHIRALHHHQLIARGLNDYRLGCANTGCCLRHSVATDNAVVLIHED